jgi:predicted AAA+ superfamily ATPase
MVDYVPRVVDGVIAQRLESAGAVVLEGPKACGKTETARRLAASSVRLDIDPSARQMAQIEPGRLLEGTTPRLIDEWQEFPAIWNHVRRAVDDRHEAGQFLLAGSSVPNDDVARHSGAGRFATVRMRPMSVAETGQSSRQVSLAGLFDGEPAAGRADLELDGVVDLLVHGGWPAQLHRPDPGLAAAYLEQTVEMDVQRVGGRSRRDPTRVRALLTSLARNTATDVKVTTLARDTPERGLARDTVIEYLDALRRIMVLDEQPAWRPHLRSSAHLRQTAKSHLADPSLAVAALGAGHDVLLADLELTGLLFESMVVRDLRVLVQPLGGTVSHLRTTQGHEIDAAVQLPDGRWGAVEVKLGGDALIAKGVDSLTGALAQLDPDRTRRPSFRAVVTATGSYAYRRDDGTDVVPLGSLGP